ncbi:MAG: OmpA family protein [Bacteroidetes bacterium]|nr:OmpA family protein [Bacteroidota bacterium]
MKKITILTLAIVALFNISSFAQKQSAVLLFDYKKSDATSEHKKQLQAVFDFFNSDSISVKIDSYCDSIGGPEYNLGLGEARAKSVKQFFKGKKVKLINFNVVNHGVEGAVASNATEEGRKINRRVVVEVWSVKAGAIKDLPVVNQDSIKAALIKLFCKSDTTVELPNGVIIKMNRCEFELVKNCISIGSYNTPEMLRKSGYTTMGPEATALKSAGVLEVKLCSDSCLVSPLKIFIPILESCQDPHEYTVWKGYSNKFWQLNGEAVKKVTMNGKEYFALETICSVAMNIAVESENSVKYKFKAKKGLKFTEIRVSYECAMGIYHWQSTDKPVKKAVIMMPCPKKDISFEVYGVAKDGQLVRMDYTASEKLKAKGKQKLCTGKVVAKKFYFFPVNFK